MHASTRIETYRGRTIFLDDGEEGAGYWWKKGREQLGYFDTLEDCRADIDDEDFEEKLFLQQAGMLNEPEDTPCLERPWWEDR